jgi:hypothetical protein
MQLCGVLVVDIANGFCYIFESSESASRYLIGENILHIEPSTVENLIRGTNGNLYKGLFFILINDYAYSLSIARNVHMHARTMRIEAMDTNSGIITEYVNSIMFAMVTRVNLSSLKLLFTGHEKLVYVGSWVVRLKDTPVDWPTEEEINDYFNYITGKVL